MKKSFYLILSFCTFALFLFPALVFPCTIRWIEGDSLFLFTSEYIQSIVCRPMGLARLVTNFLYQFYVSPWGGALVFAVIVALIVLLAYKVFSLMGHRHAAAALLYVPLAVVLWMPDILSALSVLSYLIALFLFLSVRQKWLCSILTVLFSLWGYLLIPLEGMVSAVLVMAAIEGAKNRRIPVFGALALAAVLLFFIPSLWSDFIDFVPAEDRLPLAFNSFAWTHQLAYLLPLLALLLDAFSRRLAEWLKIGAVVIITVAAFVSKAFDKNIRANEEGYLLSYLADERSWAEILELITYEEKNSNPFKMVYAMLAEQQMGTLGEHLFTTYPIGSGEGFLFRHSNVPFYMNFNRQFYDCLDVPDESFHMAFEYSTQTDNGLCMRSLRDMLDYSLRSNDLIAAEKYVLLLQKTLLMGNWLDSRVEKLKQLRKQEIKAEPNRSDTFVGGYPFNSEMIRIYEHNPKNRNAFDYLLYGLLLHKDLDKFDMTLHYYPNYKGKQLPTALAEAAAMQATHNPEIRDVCSFDPQLMQRFADFYRKMEAQQDVSQYQGTYWYYYFYTELPEE